MNKRLLVGQLRSAIQKPRVLTHNSWNYPRVCYLTQDNSLIAKQHISKKHAEREYQIGTYLMQHGVSVPRVEAIVSPDYVPIFHALPVRNWYTIHEHIQGDRFDELEEKTDELKAYDLLQEELEKVLSLGILPSHDSLIPAHSIYSMKHQRIYLLNLSNWRPATSKEIREYDINLEDALNMRRAAIPPL